MIKNNDVCIISYGRTPIGSFGGSLSSISAPELGGICIKECLKKVNFDPKHVEEVYLGNVCSSNLGQAPARQAATYGGLSEHVICTTINKVCASGMKSIMLAAQAIESGKRDVMIAGGFECMSKVPYYSSKTRFGNKLGDVKLEDGLLRDGLTNPFNGTHMGIAAELCSGKYNISRKEQDEYAILSIQRANEANKKGLLKDEILPVQKDKLKVEIDDEMKKVPNFDKLKQLNTVFKKNGTVTAGNASTISDGASCILLVSGKFAIQHNLKVIAVIKAYDDYEQDPMMFTTSPSYAIEKTLKQSNLKIEDIDYFEVNEAFSVVALANSKLLGIDLNKVNIRGGGVSLGHPLGSSGSKIVVTLLSILQEKKKRFGSASICNGGGGGSAIIIERIDSFPKQKSNL